MEKNNTLQQLQEEYKNTIEGKLQHIRILIDEMHKEVREEDLKALRIDIHKMAGSAGLYGYMPVSDICKQFDMNLLKKIEHFRISPENTVWAKEFDTYFNEIKKAFSNPKG